MKNPPQIALGGFGGGKKNPPQVPLGGPDKSFSLSEAIQTFGLNSQIMHVGALFPGTGSSPSVRPRELTGCLLFPQASISDRIDPKPFLLHPGFSSRNWASATNHVQSFGKSAALCLYPRFSGKTEPERKSYLLKRRSYRLEPGKPYFLDALYSADIHTVHGSTRFCHPAICRT